jgi:hypothetical protein
MKKSALFLAVTSLVLFVFQANAEFAVKLNVIKQADRSLTIIFGHDAWQFNPDAPKYEKGMETKLVTFGSKDIVVCVAEKILVGNQWTSVPMSNHMLVTKTDWTNYASSATTKAFPANVTHVALRIWAKAPEGQSLGTKSYMFLNKDEPSYVDNGDVQAYEVIVDLATGAWKPANSK